MRVQVARRETREAPPASDGHPNRAYDFQNLDFVKLWHGRGKVTEVERELVRRALAGSPEGYRLEIGPGGGRISPVIRAGARRYVGVDSTATFLHQLSSTSGLTGRLIRANAQRLPFRPNTFSAVVMVRVYNFLVDPGRAMGEVARVLEPGGRFVMSFHAVPSVATFCEDLRNALTLPKSRRPEPMTFARSERLLPRKARVHSMLRDAGFRILREFVVGVEDFTRFRWLPAASFVGLSTLQLPWNPLPHRFVVAQQDGKTGCVDGS